MEREIIPEVAHLGKRIKAIREEKRMTQAFVAEQLGVTRQLVAAWEAGIQAPRFHRLVKLHKVLGIPRGRLVEA